MLPTIELHSLTRTWRYFSIQPDAQSYGQAYIGTGIIADLGVLVTLWGGNYSSPSNSMGRDFGSWTYLYCFPLNLGRYNITSNISNSNVFVPRKECLTEEEYSLRDIIFDTIIRCL
ncbi:hypothetical protein I4U23_012993 [Adineta vaga]|nr:hypothetical protein I4U23_012993 [Adineta vaga]